MRDLRRLAELLRNLSYPPNLSLRAFAADSRASSYPFEIYQRSSILYEAILVLFICASTVSTFVFLKTEIERHIK